MTTDSGAEVGTLQNSNSRSKGDARDGPLGAEQRGSCREGSPAGAEQHRVSPSAQGTTRVPPKFPPVAIRTGPSVLHRAQICCPPPVFGWTSFEGARREPRPAGWKSFSHDFPYP